MKEQILLSVPTPCSEKWEEFTPTADGAFCSTCCKTIIDFTKMSDDEIVQFFSNKPLNTCGRFRNDQIREYKITANIETGFPLLKAGLLSLVMLLLNKELPAQVTATKSQTSYVQEGKIGKIKILRPGDYIIKGVVKSREENEPFPGVSIVLKGTEEGTATDADGKFEFPRKLKAGDVLVFNFIGYKPQEFVVTNPVTEEISIAMDVDMEIIDDLIIMGEVRVADRSPRFSLRKLWVNIKNVF